jgi:hypothetical protein
VRGLAAMPPWNTQCWHMYTLEHSDFVISDTFKAKTTIYDFFFGLDELEKISLWWIKFDVDLTNLYDNLAVNPRRRQIYQFKPPIPTQHDYRTVQIGWFTVFWWIDEPGKVCHIYRILNSKSDFTKAGTW